MGGPEMAPHTPHRSSGPGEAVARLDLHRAGRPGEAVARLDPQRSSRPGEAVARLDPHTLVAPRRSRGAPRPPTLGALRGSRGAPRYYDRLRVQNRAAGMAPPGAVCRLVALHLVELTHGFLRFR